MTIVVTGGLGFVGSHLVDTLVQGGHRVFVIDHRQKQKKRFENPSAVYFNLSFADPEVARILARERPEVLVHLAAQVSVTSSINNTAHDAQVNIIDSVELLQVAQRAGVRRVVFASSGGAIYGDYPELPTPLLDDATPLSPYGITKLSLEWYLGYFAKQYGTSYAALRFANLYGPRQQVTQPLAEGGVIPLFLHRLLVTGEPLVMYGSGEATRDFVFVDDAVDALVKAIHSSVNGAMNVGTGKGTSVAELTQLLFAVHGTDHPVTTAPYRAGEVLHSVLDNESARSVLGWEPRTPFVEGLHQTYSWYKRIFGSSTSMQAIAPSDIGAAVEILRAGGVLIFPTETSYGLGCDATNEQAVRRLIAIKERPDDKGLPLILPPQAALEEFIVASPKVRQLAATFWPGPLNIVAPIASTTNVVALCTKNGEQSVRKSSHPLAAALAAELGRPIVASSANISGAAAAYDLRSVRQLFKPGNQPDAYIDAGVLPSTPASTTVRCVGDEVTVVRQGSIVI